jgi:glycosyltransferase involved in cell wall biosynthesis
MRLDPKAAPVGPAPHVVILNDASVARGGATGLALLLARRLRMRGHPVTYIAGDDGDDGALEQMGVRLIAMDGAALLKRRRVEAAYRGLYDFAMRDRIARVVAEIDGPGTVYHLHGWSQILTPAIFDALAAVAGRTVVHAHDYFLACPNGSYYVFPKNEGCARVPLSGGCLTTGCDRRSHAHKLWRAARQVQVRRAFGGRRWAAVLQLHPGMTEGLVRGGVARDALHTVRNPVEPWTATRIRAEENRGLCYVGRLETGKGVALLCEAARRARLPLRVVGATDKRPDLPGTYPEVEFVGWVPRDGIAAAVRGCRALVMPSRFAEPFGLVAPEAIRSGLPVAVSDVALLARDIAGAGLGVAVDVSGPDALARGLRSLMDRPDSEIAAMSEAGFAGLGDVAQTPAAWTDEIAGIYDSALAVQP